MSLLDRARAFSSCKWAIDEESLLEADEAATRIVLGQLLIPFAIAVAAIVLSLNEFPSKALVFGLFAIYTLAPAIGAYRVLQEAGRFSEDPTERDPTVREVACNRLLELEEDRGSRLERGEEVDDDLLERLEDAREDVDVLLGINPEDNLECLQAAHDELSTELSPIRSRWSSFFSLLGVVGLIACLVYLGILMATLLF